MNAPIIRDAVGDDAADILAIYAPHVIAGTASYEEEPPTVAEMGDRLRAVADRGLPWLVAEVADAPGKEAVRVAAYAYAGPFRTRSAYRHTVENSVYVAEWAQGRGLGRTLMERLIDRCAALGHRRMVAVIGDASNGPSVALHRALGFAPVGIVPGCGHKHGTWLDLMIMQRPLGPGAMTPPEGMGRQG